MWNYCSKQIKLLHLITTIIKPNFPDNYHFQCYINPFSLALSFAYIDMCVLYMKRNKTLAKSYTITLQLLNIRPENMVILNPHYGLVL